MPIKVFQISQNDLDYCSSLKESDIGTWAILVRGCYHMFATYTEATAMANMLIEDNQSEELNGD
jgi:hypothetical protein